MGKNFLLKPYVTTTDDKSQTANIAISYRSHTNRYIDVEDYLTDHTLCEFQVCCTRG